MTQFWVTVLWGRETCPHTSVPVQLLSTLPQDTVQERQGQVCEEEPGLDPGEEGAQATPGQVSSAESCLRAWAGLPKLLPQSCSFPSLSELQVVLSCPCLSHREVRPDTKYTGRKRRPHF